MADAGSPGVWRDFGNSIALFFLALRLSQTLLEFGDPLPEIGYVGRACLGRPLGRREG